MHAIATPIGRIEEFGSEHVVVTDREPPQVSIRTMTGGTVEGRLAIDGGQPKDAQSFEYTLMAYPIDPDRAPFARRGSGLVIRSDGTFYAVGLYGPRVLALAAAPPDWYVKSVTIGGVDVTDSGFDLGTASLVSDAEIVLSAQGAVFAGRIVDGRGEPVPGSVIAFPVQRTYWTPYSRYLKHARAASDGAFEIRGLPPGEYWLAAVETLDAGVNGDEWQNPVALDALASHAERATLGESERRTVELPLLRPAR